MYVLQNKLERKGLKMKKVLFSIGVVSFVLIIGFTVLGCSGGSKPSTVVKQLHTAIEKGDTKAVKELMTEDSASLIVMFMEMVKEEFAENGGIAKMEETIDGDTAVVTVTYKDGSTDDFGLVKTGGKWKVAVDK
jgi:hypothetical protein